MRKAKFTILLMSEAADSPYPMKHPPTDFLSQSLPVWLEELSGERPYQSLFSSLLEIENRLRAETGTGFPDKAEPRKLGKGQNDGRPPSEKLSRYVE